jgi:hypothetical protein
MNANAENEHKHCAVLMCAFENERGEYMGAKEHVSMKPLIISFSPDTTDSNAALSARNLLQF